jgi:hypothetical protein
MPVGMSAGDTGDGDGGIDGGTVGSAGLLPIPGMPPSGPYAGTAPGGGVGDPIGPEGIPDSAAPSGLGVGPGRGRPIGVPNAGAPGLVTGSALPQLRQNFMPSGFSPRHTTQMPGNPGAGGGVCATACARELPQFRQNDDPVGLSWPHIEQRIVPLTLNPIRVSQQPQGSGMGASRFATPRRSC